MSKLYYRMCGWPFFSFGFALLLVVFSCRDMPAQSTSESALRLHSEATSSIGSFIELLSRAREKASILIDGEVEQQAQTLESKLSEIEQQIDTQVDFITKKEVGLSTNLSEADRAELKGALASQKKPLLDLKSKIAVFRKVLPDLCKNQIPQWRELYKSFLEIAGEAKASEKVNLKISEYLKSLPPAWKPQSSVEAAKSSSAIPTVPPKGPTSKAQPAAQEQSDDEIIASINAKLNKQYPTSKVPNPSPDVDSDWDPVKLSFPSLKKVAQQGNAKAQRELAQRYRTGFNAPRDTGEAVKWYTLAAQNGDVDSQLALGMMYKNGEGVGMNIPEAKKWLRKAASNGSQFAQTYLNQLR